MVSRRSACGAQRPVAGVSGRGWLSTGPREHEDLWGARGRAARQAVIGLDEAPAQAATPTRDLCAMRVGRGRDRAGQGVAGRHQPNGMAARAGAFQVAMGREGICIRAARYGSWELSASSPDATLVALQFRQGAQFVYECDLNIPWRHEVCLEDRQ
jgi:hypothetical protein